MSHTLFLDTLFFETADVALEFVGRSEVADRWDQPSVLSGYDVGALAAHLVRAIVTVDRYVTAPEPVDGDLVPTASDYLMQVLGDHDPHHSDFHRSVRGRSIDSAAAGPGAVRAEANEARTRLGVELAQATAADRRIEVIGGLVMRLDDYLVTRLVELCIHLDDLASSVELVRPELPAAAWDLVADVAERLARKREGPAAFALSLMRTERYDRPVAL